MALWDIPLESWLYGTYLWSLCQYGFMVYACGVFVIMDLWYMPVESLSLWLMVQYILYLWRLFMVG